MLIHKNFTGGNILVKKQTENEVFLENEIRDTMEDWFYWAFCVEGAASKTVTFHLGDVRLGYFGPAVSHNLKDWHWLDSKDGNSFTYSFGENEERVYFAHSMLYHPNRFFEFAKTNGLDIQTLCKSKKGREVPFVQFGNGRKKIILTSRHHACESTGNYVLEGVLETLLKYGDDFSVFCVPFMDFDGVVDGDQGKSRAPHDHNRDYAINGKSIYPETAAVRRYADMNGCHYGFDFHAPWHIGNENDTVFIVQNEGNKLDKLERFGRTFEGVITENSLMYKQANDYPFNYGWNKGGNQFSMYMTRRPENEVAFTLETAYFGTTENKVSDKGMVELGRCFAKAIIEYNKNIG